MGLFLITSSILFVVYETGDEGLIIPLCMLLITPVTSAAMYFVFRRYTNYRIEKGTVDSDESYEFRVR
jgi:hypothetical protein